jgi:hypothetical protein
MISFKIKKEWTYSKRAMGGLLASRYGLALRRERPVPLGAAGFEPTASITPRWHATKLRYAPCLDSSIVH